MDNLIKIIDDMNYRKINDNLYNNRDKWIEIKNISDEKISYKYFVSFQNKSIICYDSYDNINISSLIKKISSNKYNDFKSIEYGFNNSYNQPYSYYLTNDDIVCVANNIINGKYCEARDSLKNIKYSLEIHVENLLLRKKVYTDDDRNIIDSCYDTIYNIDSKFKILFSINANYMKYLNGVVWCFHSSYDTLTVFYFIDKQSLYEAVKMIQNMDEIKEIKKIINDSLTSIYELQCFVIDDSDEYLIYDDYYKNNCDEIIIQYIDNNNDNITRNEINHFFNNLQIVNATVFTNGYKCLCWNLVKLNDIKYFDFVIDQLEIYDELKKANISKSIYMQLKLKNNNT